MKAGNRFISAMQFYYLEFIEFWKNYFGNVIFYKD